MLIVGGATWGWDIGVGVAVRVEHQLADRNAVGVDVSFGRVLDHIDDGREPGTLVAVRTFGRSNPTARDWVAVTYGVGISWMDSGNVSASVQLGGAIGTTDETVAPYLSFGIAPVLVLRSGRAYGRPKGAGVSPCILGCTESELEEAHANDEAPRSDLFLYGSVGFVGFLRRDNRMSLDLGGAAAMRRKTLMASLSLADAQR